MVCFKAHLLLEINLQILKMSVSLVTCSLYTDPIHMQEKHSKRLHIPSRMHTVYTCHSRNTKVVPIKITDNSHEMGVTNKLDISTYT